MRRILDATGSFWVYWTSVQTGLSVQAELLQTGLGKTRCSVTPRFRGTHELAARPSAQIEARAPALVLKGAGLLWGVPGFMGPGLPAQWEMQCMRCR